MKKFKIFGKEIFSWGDDTVKSVVTTRRNLPTGRASQPDVKNQLSAADSKTLIDPLFNNELIPVIRSLAYTNPDVSQALDNIIQLGNTGHEVEFDDSVNEKEANDIRQYLKVKELEWSESTAGMDGLVNKMVAQVMIGGALSGEWVPKPDLTGVDRFVFVNPETIQFVLDPKTQRYIPYQRPKHLSVTKNYEAGQLVKLNLDTYKYYALNGDTELPYGIPPYMPVLTPIVRQQNMQQNIDYIIDQIGLMGFLTVLLEKPDKGTETDAEYVTRLESDLSKAKLNLKDGMRDGMVFGYTGDVEFKYENPTKDVTGATMIFEANELQVASGLKQDASLMGRSYGTTETQITIIFTKLLSQLKNIQNLAKRNLEYGYTLDLRMAGFKFKSLNVKFSQSTVMDELKFQQALEIKVRNYRHLFYDGVINLDEYAQGMGKEKADQREPRFIMDSAISPEEAKEKREKGKDKSDKKVRDKNRPQPRTLK